jgi:plastocyanin
MKIQDLLAGLVGVAFTCGAASACSSSDTPDSADAGADAASDAGSGADSGGGGTDSGGGGADSGGGGGTCQLSYAGCVAQTMVDVGATDTTVKFGVNGLTYEPKCLRIKAGQTVTFEGSFANHNLKPAACNPASAGSGDAIPVVKTGMTATAKFTKPGIYAYYCEFHGEPAGSDALMDGLVEVVP